MLNQASVVGKVKSSFLQDDGYYVLLEVQRSYKEVNGRFAKDVIKCRIWRSLSEDVTNKYRVGMILSLSGRINATNNDFYIDCYDVDYLGTK